MSGKPAKAPEPPSHEDKVKAVHNALQKKIAMVRATCTATVALQRMVQGSTTGGAHCRSMTLCIGCPHENGSYPNASHVACARCMLSRANKLWPAKLLQALSSARELQPRLPCPTCGLTINNEVLQCRHKLCAAVGCQLTRTCPTICILDRLATMPPSCFAADKSSAKEAQAQQGCL